MPDQETSRLRNQRRALPQDAERPVASLLSGAGALGAAGFAAVNPYEVDRFQNSGLDRVLRIAGYGKELPGLANNFYIPVEGDGRVGIDAGGGGFDEGMRWLGDYKGGTSIRGWPSPKDSSFLGLLRPNRDEVEAAREAYKGAGFTADADTRVPGIDWEETANAFRVLSRRANPDADKMLSSYNADWQVARNVPSYGPDLGGFARRYGTEAGPGQVKAYTVVPSVNPGRFSQRNLPELIDDVYTTAQSKIKPEQYAWDQFTGREASVVPLEPESASSASVSQRNWRKLPFNDKVRLLEAMAPNQTTGNAPHNQSGVLWGTTYDQPRYSYAESNWSVGPNPEVHVSFVDTPRELETDYSVTQSAHSPYVRRFAEPQGAYRTGPHWGGASLGGGATQGAGNRPRRDIRGDVSWRADLTKARGAFSVADAQAVQAKLGIPITGGEGPSAMSNAVQSIREHLGLSTDAEVIDRFARRLPRLGRTTAPRQPAEITQGVITVDDSPGIPSALRRAYDLPGALERAGVSPTRGGILELNTRIDNAVGRDLRRVSRMAGMMPAIGAAGGLLDPEAARLWGQSSAEPDPGKSRQLLLQGANAFGRNTVVGTAIGGAAQLGMRALANRAPAVAARVLPGVANAAAFGGPIGLGLAAYQTVDAVAEGLTGRSLTAQGADALRSSPGGQALRTAVGGRNAGEVLPQLFPAPRPVAARTPTGTAVLTRTRPAPPSGPQRLLQGVANSGAGQAIRNELQRRGQQAARARQRGSRIPGLPEFGLSEFIFGGRRK